MQPGALQATADATTSLCSDAQFWDRVPRSLAQRIPPKAALRRTPNSGAL
jgi:hypothetical protein